MRMNRHIFFLEKISTSTYIDRATYRYAAFECTRVCAFMCICVRTRMYCEVDRICAHARCYVCVQAHCVCVCECVCVRECAVVSLCAPPCGDSSVHKEKMFGVDAGIISIFLVPVSFLNREMSHTF